MAVRQNAKSIGAAFVAAFALALAGAPALADHHEKSGSEKGMDEGGMQEGMQGEMGAKGDLASKVSEKLSGEEGLSNVRAMAEEGTVTLQGTVAKSADRERAEELASGIEGVDSLKNEIEIDVASPPSGGSEGSGDSGAY